MNLVQINERLKDLPMQVLQQYANGMNPEVPPYLALGELQRREMSQKQAATAQGAAQGPQPSVKEQVEQKAGLMALQQMQQQQMAQQMQQPRGPMPVPPGAPQPEAQPQPEMMARGGLAGIPVRRDMFEYANGGIIAFQSGGQPKKYETRYDKMTRKTRGELTEEERKRKEEIDALIAQIPRDENIVEGGERADSTELGRNIKNTLMALPGASAARALSGSAGSSRGAAAGLTALLNKRDEDAQMAEPAPPAAPRGPMITSQGPGDVFAPRYPQSGVPAALQKAAPAAPARAAAPMPGAPRPAPAQVGAPTAPQTGLPAALAGAPVAATSSNPYEARLNQVALKEPVAPTAQDAINRIKELSPEAMQEEFMKKRMQEQRDRAASERTAFEKSRPSGLDDLIRVLGQAGQYKGFSGIGPAYTANQQQRRAEELAMERRQNELLNAVDAGEYERSKALFTARTGAFDTAQQLFGKEKDNVVKATASLYETTQSRINNELKMLSDKEIKMLEIEQRERERKSLNARDPNAKIAEYVGLKAKARELREKGGAENIKQADRLLAQAADMMEYGGKGLGAGAGSKPMTRDQALKTVGDILENPMMANKFIPDARAALAAQGIANPTMIQIQEYLVQQHMKGADLAAPTQTGLPSGVTVKRVGP